MAANGKAHEVTRTNPGTDYFHERARGLREYILRRGWFDESMIGTTHHPLPIRMFMEDWREQLEAWAYESLYTALTADDLVIAFRAYSQAVGYVTRMRHEYHLPVGTLGDYLSVARNRIEDRMRGE
jgi:hypothetical protein